MSVLDRYEFGAKTFGRLVRRRRMRGFDLYGVELLIPPPVAGRFGRPETAAHERITLS